MDRIEFFHNTKDVAQSGFNQLVINYFDQFMGLYSVFGDYEYRISVNVIEQGLKDDRHYIIVDIIFHDADGGQIEPVLASFEPRDISLYDRYFSITPLGHRSETDIENEIIITKYIERLKISG